MAFALGVLFAAAGLILLRPVSAALGVRDEILENCVICERIILCTLQFPEITRMIARYFKDTIAEPLAGQNAMWDTLRLFVSTTDTSYLTNPQEGVEATSQIVNIQKTSPHAMDIQMIQNALMEMLCDIKAGIQTHTPTTELATKQITQAMIANMTKGGRAQPLMPQISLEQLVFHPHRNKTIQRDVGVVNW